MKTEAQHKKKNRRRSILNNATQPTLTLGYPPKSSV